MAAKLQEHKQKKAYKVQGLDIISTGLNISGWLLLIVTAMQPKNPINIARLSIGFGLFSVSVAVERLRESDLLSLDRASEYEKNIESDRIRRNTVMEETLEELREAENFFASVPIDRHAEVAARIGIAPPNYAARQPDPVLSQMQPEPMAGSAIDEPDPSANFDPEPEELNQRESSGASFLFPDQVPIWFEELGDRCPPSLVEEWNQNPGIGIRVVDGSAHVVRREA